MCSCPLPSSNGRSPPSGSVTRSRHRSARACGSEAPCPSAMRLRTARSLSSKKKLNWSDQSSGDTWNLAASTNCYETSENATSEPKQDGSTTSTARLGDRETLARLVTGIVVHGDQLVIRLKSDNADEASDSPDDQSLTIPWQKPPTPGVERSNLAQDPASFNLEAVKKQI